MNEAGHVDGPVNRATWDDLDPRTLHDLVRLRLDVFVVEQQCAYPELDGRDVEPGTEHWWTADASGPTSCLRVLVEPGAERRVGRVATRADVRGRGLSTLLMRAVLEAHGHEVLVLDAQSPVQRMYAALGFEVCGPEFLDDGIPHVPMRRLAPSSQKGEGGGMSDYSAERPLDMHPIDAEPNEADPVADPAGDDPDVATAESELSEADDPDALATDGLQRETGDDGWEPPQDQPNTEANETLDERLAEEEPEPDPRAAGRRDADRDLLES